VWVDVLGDGTSLRLKVGFPRWPRGPMVGLLGLHEVSADCYSGSASDVLVSSLGSSSESNECPVNSLSSFVDDSMTACEVAKKLSFFYFLFFFYLFNLTKL
jgi:hypothetical protein